MAMNPSQVLLMSVFLNNYFVNGKVFCCKGCFLYLAKFNSAIKYKLGTIQKFCCINFVFSNIYDLNMKNYSRYVYGLPWRHNIY